MEFSDDMLHNWWLYRLLYEWDDVEGQLILPVTNIFQNYTTVRLYEIPDDQRSEIQSRFQNKGLKLLDTDRFICFQNGHGFHTYKEEITGDNSHLYVELDRDSNKYYHIFGFSLARRENGMAGSYGYAVLREGVPPSVPSITPYSI